MTRTDLRVFPQTSPLVGSVPVPSDKSIAHRALVLAALADGKSHIAVGELGEDNRATLAIIKQLGVMVAETRSSAANSTLEVSGVGLYGLAQPSVDLDCGNSGTTMRLLAGVLAGQGFDSRLVGDASLSRRPMRRIVEPLTRRGARIDAAPDPMRRGDVVAPLAIKGLAEGTYLGPLELQSSVASAQVKGAALLSGLFAHGVTVVHEPAVSRDHTERMLSAAGVPVESVGPVVAIDPAGWNGKLSPLHLQLPGDLSAAAFLIAAAQLVAGSRITVRGVGINPTRTGFLEIARDMGAGLAVETKGDQGGEPIADIAVWATPLSAARVGGELLVRAIDEVPILCALAARAAGKTVIVDAAELRVKESDRIRAMADVLRAFGIAASEQADGLTIEGIDAPLRAATIDCKGDHRIAMTATVLALLADGPSTILGVDSIRTSFPRFVGTMRAIGASIEVAG